MTKNVKKILLISLSNLGDIVLTTPVFRKLSKKFPGAVIDVVTGPAGAEIFKGSPSARNVIVRKRRQNLSERIKEIIRWRKERYDIVVDLKKSLVPLLAGARYRFPLFPFGKISGHMRDVHLSVIDKLTTDQNEDTGFFIPVSEEDRKIFSDILSEIRPPERGDAPIAIVNAGAKSHIKRWPPEKFARLIFLLEKELDCRVLLSGADEDRQITKSVIDIVKSRAIDICGKTTIGALYGLLEHCDVFVTNDSGPLHLASAAGTPTVAIFGPTDEKKYGPLSPENVVLTPDVNCRPCEKALCPRGLKSGCIDEVSVEKVYEAVKKVLGSGF